MAKITNKQTTPSKGLTFTGKQLSIASNAKAIATHDAADNFSQRLVDFTSLFNRLTLDGFKAARECWVINYQTAMGCESISAQNRFAEMVKLAEVVKPQSDAAKKKQVARAVTKSAIDKASETTTPVDVEKATSAKLAGASVKMELSSIEAHIVSMLRAGKFTLAAQAVALMAEQTALV